MGEHEWWRGGRSVARFLDGQRQAAGAHGRLGQLAGSPLRLFQISSFVRTRAITSPVSSDVVA